MRLHILIILIFICFSCSKNTDEVLKSSSKEIIAFSCETNNTTITANINEATKTVEITFPIGTDITKLIPKIIVSAKANLSPASGTQQDFSKPITYTVTAENGATQIYSVKATILQISSVILKTSQQAGVFWMGESSPLTLSVDVKDNQGKLYEDFTGNIIFFANGKEIGTNKYNFDVEGEVVFQAKIQNIESTLSQKFIVKNPSKELDKIQITSGFINKFTINYAIVGNQPEIVAVGLDKNGIEVPIKNNLKANNNNEVINLTNYSFQKSGLNKITVVAHNKQSDIGFNVRPTRSFEVIKIPIIFHISLGADKENAANYQAFLQNLQNGTFIEGLNKIFRNKADVSNDPNAVDTFIEFYLLDKDINGVALKQIGVNLLDYTKPTEATREFTDKLNGTLKTWNPNFCLNVFCFLNNAYGFGSASGNAVPALWDINRKNLLSADFFQLPLGSGTTFFANNTANTYVELRSIFTFQSFQTLLAHEIGHTLGLQHTFLSRCTNNNFHSDGLYDTPTTTGSTNDCDRKPFLQRNTMSYNLLTPSGNGSFTYDQVTVMRAKIEAGFSLPTPRNK